MIARLGIVISSAFRRTAPDPFVLAVLLTVFTFVLVLTATPTTYADAVDIWAGGKGIWNAGMLRFAMQMSLILVTGHALASSPPVSRMLDGLASLPRSAGQAVALVAFVAVLLALANWGLGLIGGALMAKRVGQSMAKKGIAVHYPLLAAAGYTGLMVWHGGFSGSAPLKVTRLAEITDIFGSNPPIDPIPISQTILSPLNLIITGGLIIIVPTVLALLMPRHATDMQPISNFNVPDDELKTQIDPDKPMLPRLLEDSPVMTIVLVAIIGSWAWWYYFPKAGPSGVQSLTPDTVNLTMLMLGLTLHGTPGRYVRAIEQAVGGCAGIILQFPLYAGIMGLMAASGLSSQLAQAIASASNQTTLPVMTFISAGVVNLFVPSGGGQWAVQGPIVLEAAVNTGVSPAKMVMALAYGDQLTNMLQPFWALPLLAITRVRARDIVGYTTVVMVVAMVWIMAWLMIL